MSEQDLNLALLEQIQTSELLGQVLVRMGVLEAYEINVVLSSRTISAIQRPRSNLPLVCASHLGTYSFRLAISRLSSLNRRLLNRKRQARSSARFSYVTA